MDIIVYACIGIIVLGALIAIFFKLDKEDKIYIIVMITLATIIYVSVLVEKLKIVFLKIYNNIFLRL